MTGVLSNHALTDEPLTDASRRATLRYRVGRWLIRPHVTALLEHYNQQAEALRGFDDRRASRCSYVVVGLRYAIGFGTEWRVPRA